MRLSRVLRRAFVVLLLAPAVTIGAQQPTPDGVFEEARLAWERGDYPTALRAFDRLLAGPTASAYLERIATITGEWYRTTELTTDGRAVRLARSGTWVAYERGTAPNVRTFLVPTRAPTRTDSVAGTGIVFDATGERAAYLVPAQGTVAERLVVRSLASGAERVFAPEGLRIASPAFTADGQSVLFIGKAAGESATHLWSLAVGTMQASRLTASDALRADLVVSPAGSTALWTVGRDPFATGGRAGGRAAGGGAGRGGGATPQFVVRDLGRGTERTFSGTAPSLAPDGRVVAYLERRPGENTLYAANLATDGEPVALKRTAVPLDAPAVSPDGSAVAFQQMSREDWEIYVIGTDGTDERRVTREIQHDVLPRWVNATTLLGMMGEARHRRSYLYDIRTASRTRLFHNNTVRTVAPEYEWAVSGDGALVAIVAERDGDTVSPERGVYLVDLRTPITREALASRLRAQLEAESALRAEAKRRFTPVAAELRPITERVSKDRLYTYARDLFLFDSKHITQPGNAKAIAYLDSVYKSFGYQTELQWFEPQPGRRTANIVATLRGTVSPDVVYVVGSHFDSVAGGPGSDDDTSGTTMLLETARVLARHPLPATVRFVSFTGEESGLLGSREFVRRLKADSVNLAGVLNNDMMGYTNDQRLDNTIRYSNPGIRDVQHGAALEFSKLITYDALYYKSTDAAAFYDAYGDIVGGFGSYPILGNPHYHQPHDVLETINFELVTENTKANVATMMMLAMAPSRVNGLAAERRAGRVVVRWAPNPERDIREYEVRYVDASGAEKRVRTVEPRATLSSVRPGSVVAVRAVNRRGLDGWDWGRVGVK